MRCYGGNSQRAGRYVLRLIFATLLAFSLRAGSRYTDWRWRYIAKTRRILDGRRCRRCGATGVRLDVHHRREVQAGGSYALWNLTTLCHACHEKVHGREF